MINTKHTGLRVCPLCNHQSLRRVGIEVDGIATDSFILSCSNCFFSTIDDNGSYASDTTNNPDRVQKETKQTNL